MSRRSTPGSDRAAQNAQTIKTLLKLDGNKVCADCKRNKHPRWASWNIGVFLCIRCSGIHRGMGTHISRVKSVDLDAWTDEQLQSILKWGNSRANKYWEAKLAVGHMPSEAKIENFIRTKYESKRWVMEGPMPDPTTLDADGDDDVPLTLVQEKAKIDRNTSQRNPGALQGPTASRPRPAAPAIDLFGDEPTPPIRPNTADIISTKPAPAPVAPSAKPSRPTDSLFGIDFFGGSSTSQPGRPSSAASNPTTSTSNARSDLKSSILSLYASAPKPQQQAQPQPGHGRQPSFGAPTSPQPSRQDAFGGLTDAFSSMSFRNSNVSQPRQPSTSSAFSALSDFTGAAPSKAAPTPPQMTSPPPLAGGSFFDSMPATTAPHKTSTAARSASNGLDFSFVQAPTAAVPKPAPAPAKDLFAPDDFDAFTAPSPGPPPVPPPTKISSPGPSSPDNISSAFNLSSPTVPTSTTSASASRQASRPAFATQPSSSAMNPWGGLDSNAWAASDPEPGTAKAVPPSVSLGTVPSKITPNDISGGWGAPITTSNKASQPPTVMGDEDFGGWTSASPTQTASAPPPRAAPGGFGGASDPFDNPWG